jgi:hypothetical protein
MSHALPTNRGTVGQSKDGGREMDTAYLVITLLFALMVSYSGVGKIRRDPHQVRVIHDSTNAP